MNVNPFRRNPADREQLARLLPAPAERDLPEGRHHTLREYLMHETNPAPAENRDPHPTPPRRGRRLALVGAVAAAVAVAVAFGPALVGDRASSPAWAVEEGSGDSVTVRINEFTDPDGLEARLRAEGFRTVVDYIPFDKGCSNLAQLHVTPERLAAMVAFEGHIPGGGAVFSLTRGTVGPGETLSILAITAPGGDEPAAFRIDVVPGEVGHCALSDEPMLKIEPGDPAVTAAPTVTSGRQPAPETADAPTSGAATTTG